MVNARLIRNVCALALLSVLASSARADVIMDWNARADSIATDKRLLPPLHSRVLATMHVAMFEAVNAIERRSADHTGRNSAASVSTTARSDDPSAPIA